MFLTDGWQTLIAFRDAAAGFGPVFKEKEVQPPGMDGGGPLDTTTMRNREWRSRQPKNLKTLEDCNLQVQYNPAAYAIFPENLINVNGRIVVIFPDASFVQFWGWMNNFTPASHKEGEFVLAEIKIHPSNQDNCGVEKAPFFTPSTLTCDTRQEVVVATIEELLATLGVTA